MTRPGEPVAITSQDYWYKVVDFLQQNWAVVEPVESRLWRVYFFSDTGGVFDTLDFPAAPDAEAALQRNGFRRYAEDHEAQQFIARPQHRFEWRNHPNGPIYSSGRFWRN